MQDGRERLIDQHADQGIQQALDQSEGHIEDDQALDKAVGRGQDSLIHAQDGFQRHVVELDVGRVGDEVVGRYAEHSHGCSACNSTDDGGLAALVVLIDSACHSGENRTQHEVAQLAHAGGGGALDDDVQQVLHKADDHTVHRAKAKSTQQAGRSEKSILTKDGMSIGSGNSMNIRIKATALSIAATVRLWVVFFFMVVVLPGGYAPFKFVRKALFALDRTGKTNQKRPAATKKLQQGAQTQFACRFLHPDYTVGPGVAPSQPLFDIAAGRGLYRQ